MQTLALNQQGEETELEEALTLREMLEGLIHKYSTKYEQIGVLDKLLGDTLSETRDFLFADVCRVLSAKHIDPTLQVERFLSTSTLAHKLTEEIWNAIPISEQKTREAALELENLIEGLINEGMEREGNDEWW